MGRCLGFPGFEHLLLGFTRFGQVVTSGFGAMRDKEFAGRLLEVCELFTMELIILVWED